MAETKQISATIDLELVKWVTGEAKKEKRKISQMIGILLEEAKLKRLDKKEKNK